MAKRKKPSTPVTGAKKSSRRKTKRVSVMGETRSEEYARTPIEEIVKMTTSPTDIKRLVKMVSTMRTGVRRRAEYLEKRGYYSYAADKYAADLGPTIREAIKGKTPAEARNILVSKFATYQAFYESRTSTLQGIKDIEREQDLRIFGVDDSGNPKATLSSADRKKFWALYSEYANSNATKVAKYGSDRIQQMIADFAVKGNAFNQDFPYNDMVEFLKDYM